LRRSELSWSRRGVRAVPPLGLAATTQRAANLAAPRMPSRRLRRRRDVSTGDNQAPGVAGSGPSQPLHAILAGGRAFLAAGAAGVGDADQEGVEREAG